MPIILKPYTHTQTSKEILLEIPFPKTAHADIHLSPLLLKINCSPYLFTLDLAYRIDTTKSTCTISRTLISCILVKTDEWPSEFKDDGVISWSGSRQEQILRRNQSEQEYMDSIKTQKEKKALEEAERKRELVRQQIQVERDERARIEKVHDDEKKSAEVHFKLTSRLI